MKAVIYARYSTDKQRESSIEDQARLCQRRAESEGFRIVAVHNDDGISGSMPVANRHGGAHMLADAMADRFDVLVLEGLDRLSRDQVEQERIVRRLEHRGIVIIGVADGYDSRMGGRKIMRGVRGLINEMYLDDLRHKTHRGQSGQVERGFLAGGKSYGYNIVKTDSGSRPEINEEEATWVRWIFTRYSEGWGVQRIAHELNRLQVPSPRNSTWAVSAIYGAPNKGSGILNNEMYIGRYIWNRSQWVKDPDTGRRQRISRPESEWKIVDMPDLRILDDDLWNAVRTRMSRRGKIAVGTAAKSLFGGMMSCPHCGGRIIAVNRNKYGCANRKDRGPSVCRGIIFPREEADKQLMEILKRGLVSPASQREIERQVKEIVAEAQKGSQVTMKSNQKRLSELDGEINRLVDAIATVGISDALRSRLQAAEEERERLQSDTETMPPVIRMVQKTEIASKMKKILNDLQSALAQDTKRARQIISELFGEIKVIDSDDALYVEYDNAAEKLIIACGGASLCVVAGAGFEPATFGL